MSDTGSIYIIRNTLNNKVYIGQTTQNLDKRFKEHKSLLNDGTKFHTAMREIGCKYFYIAFLEKDVPLNNLNEREQFYIDLFDSCENGYNTNGNQHLKVESGKYYKSHYQANAKYSGEGLNTDKENAKVESIRLRVPKGWGQKIKDYVSDSDKYKSVNNLICQLLSDEIGLEM